MSVRVTLYNGRMGIDRQEASLDLTTATPREIDEALAEIYQRASAPRARQYEALKSARKYERAGANYARVAASKYEAAATYQEQAETIEAEAKPYEAEYKARGGWARYFWCQSDGGHIHRGRECPSIRPTTILAWVPAFADRTPADMIAEYGCSVCTKCYPEAPAHPAYIQAQIDAEKAQKAKDADLCPGSGQQALNADFRYYTPRGQCPHCKQAITPTSTGKVRKHKMPKEGR